MEEEIGRKDSALVLNWLRKHSGARPFGEGKKRDDYEYHMNCYEAGDYYSCHDLKCVRIHQELSSLFEKAVKNNSNFLGGRYDHEGLSLHFPEKNEMLSPNYFNVCNLIEKYFILGYTLSAVYDEMHHALDYSGLGKKHWRFAMKGPFASSGPLCGTLSTLNMKMGNYYGGDYMVRIGECVTREELKKDVRIKACRFACSLIIREKSINGLRAEDLIESERKKEEAEQEQRMRARDSERFSPMPIPMEFKVMSEEEADAEFESKLKRHHEKLRNTLPSLQKLTRKMLLEIADEIRSYCIKDVQ